MTDNHIYLGRPNDYDAVGYFRMGRVTVTIGCHIDWPLDKALKYWSPTHPEWKRRREIAACLQYLKKIAKLRGWIKPKRRKARAKTKRRR